ncbi:MAG: ribosome maturation factor RimM [Nitrosomonadaceae bacterium]|nr:ribosome maturation factor RimM [Nitrosomonadaceae bacterium]
MAVMGRIVGSFGVYGWVKILPFTESVNGLLSYPIWWLGNDDDDGEWNEIKVIKCNAHSKILIALLDQCTDRTAAMKLKNTLIAIPRNNLPVLSDSGEEGYYWEDLVGLKVVNLQDEELGSVVGIIASSNDILQVQSLKEGERERLIPFINKVIVKVDIGTHQIIVDWGSDY